MAYDPRNPMSIFEGDNAFEFLNGLSNAAAIKLGTGGDPFRPDVGVCMVALEAADQIRERAKHGDL
jgi:hypothetical protein